MRSIKARLPLALRLRARRLKALPVIRELSFIRLRSVRPISRVFGYERGGVRIGRFYIESFLDRYQDDIQGRVLEVADREYTTRFGGDRVRQSDVLHANADNRNATIISDLTTGHGIDDDSFDCVILTQTIQFIYDLPAVAAVLRRILKPGGVALVTANGISQISRYDMDRWGDYWRLTSLSLRRLFEEEFSNDAITVVAYGNVLTAMGVLQGMTIEEFTKAELAFNDPDYEVMVAARVRKSS